MPNLDEASRHFSAKERALGLDALFVALLLLATTGSCAVVPESKAPPTTAKVHVQSIQQTAWGQVDGKPVTLFTLTNKNGLILKVATYGGIITELHVPDRAGKLADIVLGFDDVTSYVKHS